MDEGAQDKHAEEEELQMEVSDETLPNEQEGNICEEEEQTGIFPSTASHTNGQPEENGGGENVPSAHGDGEELNLAVGANSGAKHLRLVNVKTEVPSSDDETYGSEEEMDEEPMESPHQLGPSQMYIKQEPEYEYDTSDQASFQAAHSQEPATSVLRQMLNTRAHCRDQGSALTAKASPATKNRRRPLSRSKSKPASSKQKGLERSRYTLYSVDVCLVCNAPCRITKNRKIPSLPFCKRCKKAYFYQLSAQHNQGKRMQQKECVYGGTCVIDYRVAKWCPRCHHAKFLAVLKAEQEAFRRTNPQERDFRPEEEMLPRYRKKTSRRTRELPVSKLECDPRSVSEMVQEILEEEAMRNRPLVMLDKLDDETLRSYNLPAPVNFKSRSTQLRNYWKQNDPKKYEAYLASQRRRDKERRARRKAKNDHAKAMKQQLERERLLRRYRGGNGCFGEQMSAECVKGTDISKMKEEVGTTIGEWRCWGTTEEEGKAQDSELRKNHNYHQPSDQQGAFVRHRNIDRTIKMMPNFEPSYTWNTENLAEYQAYHGVPLQHIDSTVSSTLRKPSNNPKVKQKPGSKTSKKNSVSNRSDNHTEHALKKTIQELKEMKSLIRSYGLVNGVNNSHGKSPVGPRGSLHSPQNSVYQQNPSTEFHHSPQGPTCSSISGSPKLLKSQSVTDSSDAVKVFVFNCGHCCGICNSDKGKEWLLDNGYAVGNPVVTQTRDAAVILSKLEEVSKMLRTAQNSQNNQIRGSNLQTVSVGPLQTAISIGSPVVGSRQPVVIINSGSNTALTKPIAPISVVDLTGADSPSPQGLISKPPTTINASPRISNIKTLTVPATLKVNASMTATTKTTTTATVATSLVQTNTIPASSQFINVVNHPNLLTGVPQILSISPQGNLLLAPSSAPSISQPAASVTFRPSPPVVVSQHQPTPQFFVLKDPNN